MLKQTFPESVSSRMDVQRKLMTLLTSFLMKLGTILVLRVKNFVSCLIDCLRFETSLKLFELQNTDITCVHFQPKKSIRLVYYVCDERID